MLVISRLINEDESVWIGPDIQVTVLNQMGRSIRLGIRAPWDMSVARSEIIHQPLPITKPKTIPVEWSDLPSRIQGETVAAVCGTQPVLITDQTKEVAVLLSIQEYRRLVATRR